MRDLVIDGKRAPEEWQSRLRAIDPQLWMCWNPHWQEGPRWCILRYLGAKGAADVPLGQIPLVGLDEFLNALQSGEWSFVRALEWPDGSAAELSDLHILHLYRDDFVRKYENETRGARLLDERGRQIVRGRKTDHDKRMDEAFESANADKVIIAERVGIDMGRAKTAKKPKLILAGSGD
jgi:hypothetical protein